MPEKVTLLVYRVLFPVFCLLLGPVWLLKMVRRGGWGSGLGERLGIYGRKKALFQEPVYIHAVSVGEVLLALKLIHRWRDLQPEERFILVPTTATGMAVAVEQAPEEVQVIYAPLDIACLIRRVLRKFRPRMVILIESEIWLNLITECEKEGVPVGIANARLSPRSGHRLEKLRSVTGPFLAKLDRVGVPEEVDVPRWEAVGIRKEALVVTRNLKFDSQGAVSPRKRAAFSKILEAAGAGEESGLPIGMALSTFEGEEVPLAQALSQAGCLPVIVPRHAERSNEVRKALEGAGFKVVLRSNPVTVPGQRVVLIIDSTGELRDWTAHADVAVVGKSFPETPARGGQNPGEAILAGVPVICGPKMANFQPLVGELERAGGLVMVPDAGAVTAAVRKILENPDPITTSAKTVLCTHEGALDRTVALFSADLAADF